MLTIIITITTEEGGHVAATSNCSADVPVPYREAIVAEKIFDAIRNISGALVIEDTSYVKEIHPPVDDL